MAAPNQKIITVQKEPCDNSCKENYYAKINLLAMAAAAKKLSGYNANSFILWCYFSKNQDGFTFELSNKAALEQFGLKKDAYDKAVNTLTKEGYLIPQGGNRYLFQERPSKSG